MWKFHKKAVLIVVIWAIPMTLILIYLTKALAAAHAAELVFPTALLMILLLVLLVKFLSKEEESE